MNMKSLYQGVLALLLACAYGPGNTAENARAVAAQPPASAASTAAKIAMSASSPASGIGSTVSTAPPNAPTTVRTYVPVFLPREVQFTDEEVKQIRAAAAKQMMAYYASLEEQNKTYSTFQVGDRDRWANRTKYEAWTTEHTRSVFERQAVYTQVIFWMVIIIVASGIALTWYQFVHDSTTFSRVVDMLLKRSIHPGTKAENNSDASLASILELARAEQGLELSKDGVKITTRVLGIITLTLSMGFFYLYLAYVYPINIKDTTPTSATTAK